MVSCGLVAPVVAVSASSTDPLAIILLGPTASGKTALALALASRFPAEIVSCDSVAVYRGLDIGSAKPTAAERALVPHHLLDVTDPDRDFTAGDYARQARTAMHSIVARGATPIITGGTGLYLRALVQGLFPGPQRDDDLRRRMSRSRERRGSGWLHRLLARLDPVTAARIHANDTPKLMRAIEVTLTARRPISDQLAEGRDALTGFRLLRIGLDPARAALYARINDRAAQMFAKGILAETQSLLTRFGPVRPLEALGYRQALAVLRAELSEPDAIAVAQQGHRNYAKRQMTWFRREEDVHWIRQFGDTATALDAALALVREHLGLLA